VRGTDGEGLAMVIITAVLLMDVNTPYLPVMKYDPEQKIYQD
jgi:hypothetical protein